MNIKIWSMRKQDKSCKYDISYTTYNTVMYNAICVIYVINMYNRVRSYHILQLRLQIPYKII